MSVRGPATSRRSQRQCFVVVVVVVVVDIVVETDVAVVVVNVFVVVVVVVLAVGSSSGLGGLGGHGGGGGGGGRCVWVGTQCPRVATAAKGGGATRRPYHCLLIPETRQRLLH